MGDASREDGQVIPLLPYHLDPEAPARRPRGRPQRLEPRPGTDALQYHAAVLSERALVVDADKLVVAARRRGDPQELLRLVIETLAADAAALAHLRDEFGKRGRQAEVAQVTSRRAGILDKIASLTLEVERLGVTVLDVRSEAMMAIYGLWVSDLTAIALEVLSREQVNVLLTKLEMKLVDFEDRAEALIR